MNPCSEACSPTTCRIWNHQAFALMCPKCTQLPSMGFLAPQFNTAKATAGKPGRDTPSICDIQYHGNAKHLLGG